MPPPKSGHLRDGVPIPGLSPFPPNYGARSKSPPATRTKSKFILKAFFKSL